MALHDRHGRSIRYMRISVTDRCNLRCQYCRTQADWVFLPHDNILSYEEFARLVHIFETLGVQKIRFTGGEPFARRGFDSFLEQSLHLHPDIDFRITTNGTLIHDRARWLKEIGISCLNVSLDTFDRDRFKLITGRDFMHRVLETIENCLSCGLKVKLNAVALRSFLQHEIDEFVRFAAKNEIDVRFIEFMPIGHGSTWSSDEYWSAEDILKAAGRFATLTPSIQKENHRGPADMFDIKGGKGRIGVISAVSNHFCATCNRLRVTANGHLRTCLFSDKEYALRGMLRNAKVSDNSVKKAIARANANKPMGYQLLEKRGGSSGVCDKAMASIGG